MGNCVTVHKSTNSVMKLGVQIESPIKENTAKSEEKIVGLGFRPQSSPATQQAANFGDSSYEKEVFFDSYACLESDCEDYFSVNGDNTPSRGNTPVHPNSFIAPPQLEKTIHMDTATNSIPEPSPTVNKQLIELFNESFNREQVESNQNQQDSAEAKPVGFNTPPKFVCKSPQEYSVCSSEATPYRRSYSRKEKSAESAQCCLPSFVRSLSFSERKKRLSSNNIDGY